jgi:predicted tellurium resistance membrane protein TerC
MGYAPPMLELLRDPDAWIALLSLTMLEIVLGIDNIVFIAILSGKLPKEQQKLAYRLGLAGAMGTRILLLFTLSWVMQLTEPLFTVAGIALSGRHFILLGGGLFLIAKATHEIYEKVEIGDEEAVASGWGRSLPAVVTQIMILDVVFSLDSVITAVGMANHIAIMATAIIIAILIMLLFAEQVGRFVNEHPSMKILALSFLLLIGVLLTAEGLNQHIDKRYIYFAMGFSLVVELLNLRLRKKTGKPPAIPAG